MRRSKEETSEYNRRYYAEHKAEIAERRKKYSQVGSYQRKREYMRPYMREYMRRKRAAEKAQKVVDKNDNA